MLSLALPNEETRSSIKRNKPSSSRLRQQKLPTRQLILTARTVIPTVFLLGIIFIPIGVLLIVASNSVKEWDTYYDHCNISTCFINFNLSKNFEGNVFFYYGLDNFFQNHRGYMKSRSDEQLLGDLNSDVEVCKPYNVRNTSSGEKKIAPCGAIANSMFNDVFTLKYNNGLKNITVPWTHEGLVWEVDRKFKYRNPPVPQGKTLCDVFENQTTKPLKWVKKPCQLDPNNEDNNGFQNTDFIIWMRTAALPNFRKPYRILIKNQNIIFKTGLPAGNYILEIENNFNVSAFFGRKRFIISTTSWAGGKNSFLGIAYVVVGIICIILSIAFFGLHKKFGYSINMKYH